MKLYKAALVLLALIATTAAAGAGAGAESDLERAANTGDSSALEAALKAGAKIDTKFDVGRTALIIAAKQGHVAIVEALLDAGADMYIRDNNGHDALTIASEYEQPAVVRALLNRGFNPSLNKWRALKLLPDGRSGNPLSEKQKEIQAMLLEEQKKRGGGQKRGDGRRRAGANKGIGDTGALEDAAPVVIDTTGKKVTSEVFKTAATRALLRRGWQIIKNEDTLLVGTLTKDITYKVKVTFSAPVITISFLKGFASPKQNYLLNIRKDLLFELNAALIAP